MIKYIKTSEKVAGLFLNNKLHNLIIDAILKGKLEDVPTNDRKKISMDIEKFQELAIEIHNSVAKI